MSTQPGATTSPVASISRRATPALPPALVMTPSSIAMSPVNAGAPVPSTILPLRITRSCIAACSSRSTRGSIRWIQYRYVKGQPDNADCPSLHSSSENKSGRFRLDAVELLQLGHNFLGEQAETLLRVIVRHTRIAEDAGVMVGADLLTDLIDLAEAHLRRAPDL